MPDAVATVRRIVTEKPFGIWAKGGDEALTAWLYSDAGTKWLKASDTLKKVRSEARKEGTKLTNEELLDMAVADYVNMRMTLFGDYEATAPTLYADMVKMASGELPSHTVQIKKSIQNAYKSKGENPTIDVHREFGSISGPFATMTKWGMTPNRFNRTAVYYQQFNDTFAHLKKEGLSDADAADIAANVAQTKTSQIHFDLSEAFAFEIRHRWFAYFGTKHRLWNTWLAKFGTKNPLYSAAIGDFLKWMEDRNMNSDEETPEWEKFNLNVKIGGKEFGVNLASYTWTSHYAPESTMGLLAERGLVEVGNSIFGTDWVAAPKTFDYSATRMDQLFLAMKRAIEAPGIMPGNEANKDTITKYIDGLDERERNNLTEQMAVLWALDPEKSVEDCFGEVVGGNILHPFTTFLKPSSTVMHNPETRDLEKRQREYYETPDSKKPEYLEKNPDVAMSIGAWGRDPYEHRKLVAGLTEYRQIRKEKDEAILAGFRTGQIEQPGFGADLHSQMLIEIDKLKARNDTFAQWYGATHEDSFVKNMSYLFPVLTAEDIEKMKPMSEDEKNQARDKFVEKAKVELERYGLSYNSTTPLARRIKYNNIDVPMQQLTGELPWDLTAGEKNNYRVLAKGAEPGMYRHTQYIEMVLDNKKRDLWLKGLTEGKADVDNLLFMFLSPQEKDFMGVKPDEDAEKIWDEVCYQYTNARTWLDTQIDPETGLGIKSTSKKGKEFLRQVMAETVEKGRSQNAQFKWEWDLSQMDARERFEMLGYAEGNRPAAEGWRYFFDCMDEMWANLTAEGLTTAEGSHAAPIVRATRKKLAKLTKDEDFMWEWNRLGLSLNKFGINYWKLPDRPDYDLYKNDPGPDAPDIYDQE
jgi:hypothetical protein